jgi:hypothetical protein
MNLRMQKNPATGEAYTEYYVQVGKGKAAIDYLVPYSKVDLQHWEKLRRTATDNLWVSFSSKDIIPSSPHSLYAGVIQGPIQPLKGYNTELPPPITTYEGTIHMRRVKDPRGTGRVMAEYYISTNPIDVPKGKYRIDSDELENMKDALPTLFRLAHEKARACFSISEEPSLDPYYEGRIERGTLKILKNQAKDKDTRER